MLTPEKFIQKLENLNKDGMKELLQKKDEIYQLLTTRDHNAGSIIAKIFSRETSHKLKSNCLKVIFAFDDSIILNILNAKVVQIDNSLTHSIAGETDIELLKTFFKAIENKKLSFSDILNIKGHLNSEMAHHIAKFADEETYNYFFQYIEKNHPEMLSNTLTSQLEPGSTVGHLIAIFKSADALKYYFHLVKNHVDSQDQFDKIMSRNFGGKTLIDLIFIHQPSERRGEIFYHLMTCGHKISDKRLRSFKGDKEKVLDYIKNLDVNPQDKANIIEQALDKKTNLGRFFHLKRGFFKPNKPSGCLGKLSKMLKKEQIKVNAFVTQQTTVGTVEMDVMNQPVLPSYKEHLTQKGNVIFMKLDGKDVVVVPDLEMNYLPSHNTFSNLQVSNLPPYQDVVSSRTNALPSYDEYIKTTSLQNVLPDVPNLHALPVYQGTRNQLTHNRFSFFNTHQVEKELLTPKYPNIDELEDAPKVRQLQSLSHENGPAPVYN